MVDSLFLAHTIGPTFGAECAEVGLQGLAFSYGPDGVTTNAALDAASLAKLKAVIAAHDPTKPAPAVVPDGPTLGDWRVGLLLWTTPTGNRRDELDAKVSDLAAIGNVMAEIAKERSQFSNNVFRAQLMVLKDAIGFTEADVDESLYRAHQVSLGDLSGVWPLPTPSQG